MDAVMHRAAMNGGFEKCGVGMILRDRHGDGDGQTDNASRSVCAHFLMDHDFHACEIEFFALGYDAHDGGHAGTKGGGNEIGGGKCLAATVVIDRGIGDKSISRGNVQGGAVKLSFVINADFYHVIEV